MKETLGFISAAIALSSYGYYISQILAGRVKPHAFSWLVWSLLSGIVFFAQIISGAGAGSWVTGTTASACVVIFFLALRHGQKNFHRFDWLALIGAILGIIVWQLTSDPVYSVILVTAADFVAFLPTYRVGWQRPHQESAILYSFSALKYIIALFALEKVSLTTALFPSALLCTNGAFVVLLLLRRSILFRAGKF